VKSFEYGENGVMTRVEFWPPEVEHERDDKCRMVFEGELRVRVDGGGDSVLGELVERSESG
jgi:hypothetical protein